MDSSEGKKRFVAVTAVRCDAAKDDGSPCRNFAIFSSKQCYLHGGATPDNLEAARERLTALVGPAIAIMYKVMHEQEVWDEDKALVVKAALAVMDRAGLHAKSAIDVNIPDLRTKTPEELQARIAELAAEVAQMDKDDVDKA